MVSVEIIFAAIAIDVAVVVRGMIDWSTESSRAKTCLTNNRHVSH